MEDVTEPYNCAITYAELQGCLSSTKQTIPVKDEITYNMLKRVYEMLRKLLLKLYNKIYQGHSFPTKWLISVIVSIHKKGKDSRKANSYRPISSISCMCKLLEKVVNIRSMWYLEKEQKIMNIQAGFRKQRSTTDPIVEFETATSEAIASKQHLIAVFFDLRKAYDTAWNYNIIRKLIEYGVIGHLIHFIRYFLLNRLIAVRIKNTYSELYNITEGIPQGSVLSYICFLIAVNDIEKGLPQGVHKTLYVDDFAIFYRSTRVITAKRKLQEALNKISGWTTKTGFQFCRDTTVVMHICRTRNCIRMLLDLYLNNSMGKKCGEL